MFHIFFCCGLRFQTKKGAKQAAIRTHGHANMFILIVYKLHNTRQIITRLHSKDMIIISNVICLQYFFSFDI